MRVEQIAMGLVCLLGSTGTGAAQEPVRPRGAAVTIASCPATAAQTLMTVDLGERSNPDLPAAAVLEHGGGQLNTFAAPRTDTIDLSACRVVAAGKIVARDVAIRIPRDTCETARSLLATDLLLVEMSAPLLEVTDGLVVVRNGRAIGSVVAVAGRRVLVNALGAVSEKAYRSLAADGLTARVRHGELSIVGREDGAAVVVDGDVGQIEAQEVAAMQSRGDQAAVLLPEPDEFVFVTSAACEKDQ